jgi:predicted metal-dependent hydrolase
LAAIQLVISKRAAWIIRKLEEVRAISAPMSPKEFVDGETVRYLGRCYRLRITESPQAKASCKLISGWLKLVLQPPANNAKRSGLIHTQIVAWYRAQARVHLEAKLSYWRGCYGSQTGKLIISNQANRWGSCDSKNNIRINWRIMMAAPSLIDYVVAHEIAHTIHKNHSADFWRLLGSVMPDYDLRRDALKRIGPQLTL